MGVVWSIWTANGIKPAAIVNFNEKNEQLTVLTTFQQNCVFNCELKCSVVSRLTNCKFLNNELQVVSCGYGLFILLYVCSHHISCLFPVHPFHSIFTADEDAMEDADIDIDMKEESIKERIHGPPP